MSRKITAVIVCSIALNACGSMKTLGPDADKDLVAQKRISKTRCKKIPRTYSGVAYVICMSYRNEGSQENQDALTDTDEVEKHINRKPRSSVPGSSLFDLFLSGVIDTIVLPYTLYKQLFDGSYNLDPDTAETGPPRNDF